MTARHNSKRRTPRRAGEAHRGIAAFAIGMLSMVTGFVLAAGPAAGHGGGPMSDASEQAAQAAGVLIALGQTERVAQTGAWPVALGRTQFIAGEEHVLRVAAPTRIRVGAVGIDAEVRSVGYAYRAGRLEYDVPRYEAGHYVDTAAPGGAGNTVISGHVSHRGGTAVFDALPGVTAGDVVEVFRGDEVFRYSVTEIRVVAADATAVMRQTHDATLTLITCFPGREQSHRLVVVGKML